MASATHHQPGGRQFFHPALQDRQVLRTGGIAFRFVDVLDYQVEERVEQDWDGQCSCAIGYALAASLILIGILLGMDWKFGIAVGFLSAIAAMSLGDAVAVRPVITYWIHMALRDGEQASFVDADADVINEIARRIEQARTSWS
jgi:hypothetical protein